MYQQWKEGEEPMIAGTPLKDWGVLSAEDLDSMKRVGFHTVEQLADPTADGSKKLGAHPGLEALLIGTRVCESG